MASIDIEEKPQIHMAHSVTIPGRTLAIICVYNNLKPHQSGSLYEIEPSDKLLDKYPNLCIIPMMHNVDIHRTEYLPLVVINLSSDDISLSKGETMVFMQTQPLEISEIMTETSTEPSTVICEERLMRCSWIKNIDTTQNIMNDKGDEDVEQLLKLPLTNDILSQLQSQDLFCSNIIAQIKKGNVKDGQTYKFHNNLLKRNVTDSDKIYETLVMPKALTAQILKMAHDDLGHNGMHRTYMLIKRLYYWKGLKPSVIRHIQRCYYCQRRNKQVVKYATLHFNVATFPMQFISMDLIGEFHPPTSKGKRYALTVICMLTGYVFCTPLKTKTAEEVLQAYIDNVYSKFGGSLKILSDNGTEFKNKIFEQAAKELGVVYKLYTSPYHPASNGRIEGFHAFLKACLSKHLSPQLEWDDLVPLACAAYNFIPNEHSKESPFFLMFGRDPVLQLNTLMEPKIRYMGNNINILSLETMKNIFEIATTNLKLARERGDPQGPIPSLKLQPGNTILVQNHNKGPFDPKCIGDYRVVSLKGNQVEIQPAVGGPTEMKHIKHIKYILPADKYITKLPDYTGFGRKTTLRINPDQIPDLHWKLADMYHTMEIGQSETTTISVHDIHIKTLTCTNNLCLDSKTYTVQSIGKPFCSLLPIT